MNLKRAHPFGLPIAGRVKGKMADFSGKTVATSKNSSVEDHARSDSNIQKEQAKIAVTFPAAERKLCQCRSVGVILDKYRDVQLRGDGAFQIDMMQRKVGALRITPCVSTSADMVTPTPRKRRERPNWADDTA